MNIRDVELGDVLLFSGTVREINRRLDKNEEKIRLDVTIDSPEGYSHILLSENGFNKLYGDEDSAEPESA